MIPLSSSSPRRRQVVPYAAVSFFLSMGLAPAPLLAGPTDTYVSGPLVFQTSGQSMWGPGPAFKFDESLFVGTSWSTGSTTIGGIAGSVTDVPCVPVPVVGGCLPGTGITIDTRTGAEVTASTSGKVGLNLSATLDSGSVDATVGFEAQLDIPKRVEPGEFVDLNPTTSFSGPQSFSTNLAEASASMEGVLGAKAPLAGTGCFIGFGCASGSTTVGFDPQILEIVSFNDPITSPGQIKILGIADPALFQFGEPIDIGPFGSVTVHIPDINTMDATPSGGMFQTQGMSDLLDMRVNLASLLTTALGLPPVLGASVTAGPLNAGYDLIRAEIGPTVEILQDFVLEPTLMIQLAFDKLVNIEGLGPTMFLPLTPFDALPRIALMNPSDIVAVTPTFAIDALFRNLTTLGIDGVFDVSALSASFSLEAFGLSIDVGSLGPLFSHSIRGDLIDLPTLFDSDFFSLGGFDMISGTSFTLQGVPEPGTLALVGVALLNVVLAARRKKHGKRR